jgi:hypothetical protein
MMPPGESQWPTAKEWCAPATLPGGPRKRHHSCQGSSRELPILRSAAIPFCPPCLLGLPGRGATLNHGHSPSGNFSAKWESLCSWRGSQKCFQKHKCTGCATAHRSMVLPLESGWTGKF